MKFLLLVLVALFAVAQESDGKQAAPIGFKLEGISQEDIDLVKAMFLPGILEELKHIEVKDMKQEDGSTIQTMTIDCKFPDIKSIDLKINEKSISLNFPHFGFNVNADVIDANGNPSQVQFSVEDLSMTGGYSLIDDKNADIDFSMDINKLKIKVHSTQPQETLN